MKEINIARAIVKMRKEKGITQDELAGYIGVSKASVSKWETGHSYPDITFLPQLATYFNISVDELIGYEPQMAKPDIRKLYLRLSEDFGTKPFAEVMKECQEIIKKYYSCFPLLLQMGTLLVNYSMISGDAATNTAVMGEAKELFIRVKKESDDVELTKQALCMEALCSLTLGTPEEVVELLEGKNVYQASTETLLATAYQMTGKIKEAKAVLQAGIYHQMVSLLGILPTYLMLCADETERFEEVHRRAMAVAETFRIRELHPSSLLSYYLAAAQGYMAGQRKDLALAQLESYTELAIKDISTLEIKGDDFFDLIDSWLDEFPLGRSLPRDKKTIKQSMVDAVQNNPAFSTLTDERRFQVLLEKLKTNC